MMDPVFDMDGEIFYVDVISMEREFTYPVSDSGGTTMDGAVHLDTIGAYCHYTMTVRAKPGRENDLNLLWEHLLLSPSHNCYLPYGDGSVSRTMYVTGGKQSLVRSRLGENSWGELTVRFIATAPWEDQ